MNKLLLTCLSVVVLLATSVSSHAADVTITPPAASGFVVKNAAGTLDRMRVQESGAVSFPDLTNAASADTTLCFVAATGRLGPCSESSVTRTLQGTIQKGPYIFGSNVWISELDSHLNQNGKSYIVQTNSDYGNFDGPTITAKNVEMLGDGYYMDELTGGLSVGRLMLRAIVDLSVDAHPIINILTTIQTPRLKFLLKSRMAYAAAYSQSQREVISAFGINPDTIVGLGNLSQMNISGNRDQDAVLLSASVVLLKMAANSVVANPSSSSTAELSRLVSVIARDLEKDGVLNDAGIISARRTANTQINLPQVRTNVESYYASIGQTLTAPKFEEWVDVDASGVLPRRVVPFSGLSFTDVTAVEPNQIFTSNAITLAGFGSGAGAAVTVSAGTTIVKNGSAASGTTLTAVDGDTIALRVTSLGYGLTKSAPITVGSSSATWHVTTKSLGGTISGLTSSGLVLQNNGGDNITIAANATSFSFPTSVANGATYSVSVLTQPKTPLQICISSFSTGTAGAGASNISVVCTTPTHVAYSSGNGGGMAFGIDPTSGRLTPFGAFGSGSISDAFGASIAADPTGKFVYEITSGGTINSYSVNTATGSLTRVSFVASAQSPRNIAVDPTGKFALVSYSQTNVMDVYSINATTGELTKVTGSPFTISSWGLGGIAFDPTGKFVFVTEANDGGQNISVHSLNPTTGFLTAVPGSPFSNNGRSFSIAVDPTGKFLISSYFHTATADPRGVSAFTINPATGALANVGSIAFADFAAPASIAIEPTGKFVYVDYNGSVLIYSIDAMTGALTSVGTQSGTGGPRSDISFDPTGTHAYINTPPSPMGGVGSITNYAINPTTGLLTVVGLGSDAVSTPGVKGLAIVRIR